MLTRLMLLMTFLVGSGCPATTPAKPDEPAKPAKRVQPGLGEAAVVYLLDAGAEPRQPLRWAPENGHKGKVFVAFELDIATGVRTQEATFDARVAYEIADAASDGFDVKWRLDRVSMSEAMKGLLGGKNPQGTSGVFQVDPVGEVLEDAEVEERPLHQRFMEGLREMVFATTSPFPEPPVGVGARWEVRRTTKDSGIPTAEVYQVKLLERHDDIVKVAIEGTGKGQGLPVTVEASGTGVQVEDAGIEAKGMFRLNLKQPFASAGMIGQKSFAEMVAGPNGPRTRVVQTGSMSAQPWTPPKRVTGPIATVGGESIDASVFYSELDKITARNSQIPPDRLERIAKNIMKRLVDKKLIAGAIKKANIAVSTADIDAAFADYKKRFQSEEQFQNYLRHGRVTVASIRQRLEEKKALDKLLESTGRLKVTKQEVKDFYTKNARFYVEKAGVKASHILIKVTEDADPSEVDAARARIEAIRSTVTRKNFAEVAKAKSEGPSAPKGGDLGFFSKGQMVKPFEEVAFKLKKGRVSPPVRTRFGFHLILVRDKRKQRKKPFKEVAPQIRQSLHNKKFFQERRKLLEDLRKTTPIEVKLPAP